MVFKTTCVDRRKPLRESAFFFTRIVLFPPLNKRNTRDNVKGLCISLEKHIGELGVRCLSALNRGQDSRQQALVEAPRERACCYCGEGYGKGFAVGGSVGFRKGRYAHLYNCVVGAISRVDF